MKTLTLLLLVTVSAFAQSGTADGAAQLQPGAGNHLQWHYNSSPTWYGSTDKYNVGDTWHAEVAGTPYSMVSVVRYQNGVRQADWYYWNDWNGKWSYNGTRQQSDIGFWTETWTVDGFQLPMIEYTVWPAGWNGSFPIVYLSNLTTGNADFFNYGDSYLVQWVGPPYAAVQENGVKDGVTITGAGVWYLPASGYSYYYGTMGPYDVAEWTQSWTMNGQPPNTLHFKVFPQ